MAGSCLPATGDGSSGGGSIAARSNEKSIAESRLLMSPCRATGRTQPSPARTAGRSKSWTWLRRESWRQDDPSETGEIEKLQFSPDGRRLLVSFNCGKGSVWNVPTHRRLYALETNYDLVARWSPDGTRIATCLSGVVHVRNADTGREQPSFAAPELTSGEIGFLERGKNLLVTDCKCGAPRIWDPRTGEPIDGFPKETFSSLDRRDFSLCGQVGGSLLFASLENRFLLHDCNTGKTRELASLTEANTRRDWLPVASPDGSKMLVDVRTARGSLVNGCWNQQGAEEHRWELWSSPWERPASVPMPADVGVGAIMPDNERVLGLVTSGKRNGPQTFEIRLWKMGDYEHAAILHHEVFPANTDATAWNCALSRDGKYFAVNMNEGAVLLDVGAKKALLCRSGFRLAFAALSFSADGRRLCNGFGQCCVWDTETGKMVLEIGEPGTSSCAISHDGAGWQPAIAAAAALWDVASGKRTATFPGQGPEVRGLAFSPDDSLLVSALADCTMISWGLDSRQWPTTTLDCLWEKLAERDAAPAYRAAQQMIERGDETAAFLAERIQGKVRLSRRLPYADPRNLQMHRVAYVPDCLGTAAAQRLRARISYLPVGAGALYQEKRRLNGFGEPLPPGAVLQWGTRPRQ